MTANLGFLAKYKLLDKIHESCKTLICRGIDQNDLQPVILKIPKSDSCKPEQLIAYTHHYAIASKLDSTTIIEPLGWEKYGEMIAIIMPDEGYISLNQYFKTNFPLSIPDFLTLALKIVEVVTQLHQRHIVHQQLNLDHCLIQTKTKEIKLTDFSHAICLEETETNSKKNQKIYLADLSDLGRIFNQLLTGIIATKSINQLEISQQDIPLVLREIITRLLNSDKPTYYTNIKQLQLDLNQCWHRWQNTHNLAGFSLNKSGKQNQDKQPQNIPASFFKSAQFFQLLLDSNCQEIFWKDRNSVYLGCNRKFAQSVGLEKPEEIVGKTDYDLPWKEKAQQYRQSDRNLVANNLPQYNLLETYPASENGLTYLNINRTPIQDEQGNVIGILGTIQDITPQKKIEQLLRQQIVAIEACTNGVAILVEDKFTYLNQAHAEIFGYDEPEELLNQHWRVLYDELTVTKIESKIFPILAKHRHWQGELLAKRRDGSCFDEELSLILTEEDLLVCVCRDVTQPKAASLALQNQLQKTELLNQITQAIRQSLNPQTIFQTASTEIRQLLAADRVSIFRFDDQDCSRGEFVAEDVLPQYPSALTETIQNYCIKADCHLSYRQGKPLAIADIQDINSSNEHLAIWQQLQVSANLTIPLVSQSDQLWGLLCIDQCCHSRQWQESEIEFVQEIATQLSVAIQQAQLLATEKHQQLRLKQEIIQRQRIANNLERRIQWELLLAQISQVIRQSLDVRTIFTTATQEIRQNLNADRVSILKFEPNDQIANCLGQFVAEDVLPQYVSLLSTEIQHDCFADKCWSKYRHGTIVAIADVHHADLGEAHLKLLASWQVQAQLVVPLMQQCQLWGLLCVHQCGQVRKWEQIEIDFLRKIATQLDVAFYQAKLLQQAQEQKQIQTQATAREKILTRIIKSIHQTLDIEQIYLAAKQAIAEIKQLFHCAQIAIYQFTPNLKGKYSFESATSGLANLVNVAVAQPNLSIVASQDNKTLTQASLATGDKNQDYQKIIQQFQNYGYLSIAIFVEEQLWGLIATIRSDSQQQWQPREISFLEQVADQLGIAFQQAELLQQLQLAKRKADKANQAKTKFLASMSHELRTPLNAILGFSQLMQRDQQIKQKHRENLKIINNSGEHLLNLINDVLEMSKIEAGKITYSNCDFDLYYTLDSLEQMLRQKAISKGLRLDFWRSCEVPKYIHSDESKLRQILINLLDNAIKFTPKGSVGLKVSATPSNLVTAQSQLIYFEITDTGVGIAEAEIENLFDPFYQSESTIQLQEGTGLGLSISRQFVQFMGGDIKIESKLGVGTSIKFQIEAQIAKIGNILPKKAKQIISLAPDCYIPRILIAEDQWESRQLLLKLLESIGFQVRAAATGLEAVNLWQDWQPHFIWMDIEMPEMNGYQAIAKIRQEEAKYLSNSSEATVIVALTASVFTEKRDKIIFVGGNDVVIKPFQESVILETMAQYLKLDFIYAESEDSLVAENKVLTEAEIIELLSSIDSAWLSRFYSATIELNEKLILELIEQLDHNFNQLYSTLEIWLDDFKFDSIKNCVEQARDKIDLKGC